MIISHIKKMPKGKYKLTFDNEDSLILYEDIIIKNVLLKGKTIDNDLYTKITNDNYKEGAYQQSLNYISIKMRSEEEIKNYLLKKEYEDNLIEETITRLKKDGFIDDYAFAIAYVNDRLNLSNDGINKIKRMLVNYNIDEDIIDKVISNVSSNVLIDKINNLISKQIRLNTKYTGNILKGRILNYLINLGYDTNFILEQLESYDFDKRADIEREYQKLYKKYANKYTGYKLDMTIKQKLYQKGYCQEDIESIK